MSQLLTQSGAVSGLLAVIAAVAIAQQPIVVPEIPSCRNCAIVAGSEVTLGDPDTPELNRAPVWVSSGANGQTFVLEEVHEGGPFVYDGSGRFVRRIGGSGGGPGEFRLALAALTDAQDSVWVFDVRAARRSVHSPADPWSYVRSVRGPTGWSDVRLLRDQRFVTSRPLASADGRVTLLQVFGAEGEHIRGIATAEAPGAGVAPRSLDRALAASVHGVWAAQRLGYRLDEWTLDGALRRSLVRRADWFPTREVDPGATDTRAPLPVLQSLRVDDRGRLWIAVTRAAPSWREGVGTPSVRAGDVVGWTLLDRIPQLLYETVVDVIDPDRGALIATTVIPGFYPWLLADGRIAGYRTDEDQVPRVVVRALRLTGAP
ncbi:MAG: hypothetical protein KF689_14175 [Gemmatimonadaceae bacterium]|nr:hypothetical protein [Gemmatimonadaceae bacterium]MCW5826866.1 hypothetical protein [Gemmatimonadaceae bacterium]